MASLMNRPYTFNSSSLPYTCLRCVCRVLLVMATANTLISLSYAEEPLTPQNNNQTAAWDWVLLDWKTLDQLSPEQRASVPTACCGAFVQPDAEKTESHDNPGAVSSNDDDISITGNSSQITKESTVMTGDVILIQGQRKISGDTAELFNQPQGARLQGNVLFREPGFLLQGSEASVDLEQNTLQVENARYVLHEQRVHGEAAQIKRDEQGVITLTDSTYSACTPGDELWFLKSSAMTLDPVNGQGSATNVRVEVFDVPIFYFPYLFFPIGGQRHSGFLAPSLAHSNNATDISLPYYLNLAPNYDAMLVPRMISNRGAQIGGEFRYLGPSSNSSVSATWLGDDKLLGEKRWLLGLKQNGGQYRPWSTLLNITRVSDNNYFNDLDNSGLSVSRSTNLQQHAAAGYMTDRWDTSIDILEYQTLRSSILTDPYQKLPDIGATGDYYLGNGFTTQLSQHITRFDSSDQNRITGDRLNGDYRLGWRGNWQAGYISPAIELHYLEQQLNNSTGDSNPAVTIPSANVDMGLVFIHDNGQYQQTLEPRIFYNYTEYKNQNDFQLFDTDEMTFTYSQLFRDYRFSSSDRIGDANQTSVGLTSRWIDQATGAERLQIGAGKIFYNEDRKVLAYDPATFALLPQSVQKEYTDSQSPIVGSLQWSVTGQWRLKSELTWSEEDHKTKAANVFLHYQGSNNALFSIGHRYVQLLEWTGTAYVEEPAEQGDVSTYLPVTDQWSLVGRAFYDFTNQRHLETLVGFQYEDCCWKLRTVLRQWATNPNDVFNIDQQPIEKGIYLEIQFKNLAGVGTKTNNMLKEGIYGYDKND